jgi:hypothetical protein
MPPEERTEFYRKIGLEDVDTAIRDWFDRVVDAHVETPTSDREKVLVTFGSNERWTSAKDSAARDASGKIILPIICLSRKSFDPATGDNAALGTNTPRLTVSKRVSQKTNLIKNALSERPISSRGGNATVYEITTIPFPSSGTATYELVIHAQYVKQLNTIIEKVLASLEYYQVPTFVAYMTDTKNAGAGNERTKELEPLSESQYENRPPIDGYYFVGFFEPGMSDSGNFDEFTDEERIVRYTTQITVPVYLHLDPEGKVPAVRVEKTAFKVGFKDETTTFVDDPLELELIFGPNSISER